MSVGHLWLDLYARSELILRVFSGQFVSLTPLWLLGVWLGATLAWFMRSVVRQPTLWPGYSWRFGAPLGLLLGGTLGLLSPFSLLSLTGLLHSLLRQRRLMPLAIGLSLANPLLDPTMLTFTALAVSPRLAWARAATALVVALVGGFALLAWERWSPRPLPSDTGDSQTGAEAAMPRTLAAYGRSLLDISLTTGRYYLLSLLVVAWIEVCLPLRNVWPLLLRDRWASLFLAAGLGGPLYLCGGGAVTIVRELLAQGLSVGAALAFLTFGPATTVRTLVGLSAIGGRRMVLVLVVSAFVISILAGSVLNLVTQGVL